jgi:tripeptidyl-peptidase-1
VEGNLDSQYITAVGQDADTSFYVTKDLNTPFLSFIERIAALSKPPSVLSISYGGLEREMDHGVMDSFTAEAMKLGAMGVTFLAATGDDGVASYMARNDTSKCGYTVAFPASCPYVTAVGGTQNAESDPDDHEFVTNTEWAADSSTQVQPGFKITTAGGFSNYFAVASYQKSHVQGYLNSTQGKAAKPGFNVTGRAIPDISMSSYNFIVFITSFFCAVSGTSASSPIVAGMISQANAKRAAAGKANLGFVNPLLYANPAVFNDVINGKNNCTAMPQFCCDQGFQAAPGWDPTTGLGSPDMARLLGVTQS